MKLTRQGRRELHDEIMSAIRDRIGTTEFFEDVVEIVLDETAEPEITINDLSWNEWNEIVRKEVNVVIERVFKQLRSPKRKR